MSPHIEYIVLCGQVVGGNDRPFTTEYSTDHIRSGNRDLAIRRGFKARGSDDFNIGVLREGKLVSVDWMEKPVDTDPALMAEIAKQIGLESSP